MRKVSLGLGCAALLVIVGWGPAAPPPVEPQPEAPAPHAVLVDVIEDETDTALAGEDHGEAEAEICWVTFWYQSSSGRINPKFSKVKVRGGAWRRLDRMQRFSFGLTGSSVRIIPYSDHPEESLFWFEADLTQSCDKRRRYRFKVLGQQSNLGYMTYQGVERELYYPSPTGWTTRTKIDLGYLELCLADASKCNKPYYPGNRGTPPPPS